MRLSTEERFWSKVNKEGPTMPHMESACWVWTGRCYDGYGQCSINGLTRTHRVAWTLTNGPIPDRLCVLHRCDNPPCCNPAHLWLGTNADNVADRERKGRGGRAWGDASGARTHPERLARGEAHGHATLTDDAVRAIRAEHASGVTLAAIAHTFGTSRRNVIYIVRRQAWKHVA